VTPWGSPDDLLGVVWDLQKFAKKAVSVWIYLVHYQRCSQNLYCFKVNTESSVLQWSPVILAPPSTLCETEFPSFLFFFRSMLPRQDQMAKVATLLADGPLLEAFNIGLHLPASNTASSVFPFLVMSLLPGHVQSISFSCCVHLLRLFLLQSFPSLPYLLYILSNWISIFFSMFTFWKPSHSRFSHGSSLCSMSFTILLVSVCIIFSSDSCLSFDSIVRPCVEGDLLCVLAKNCTENFRSDEKEVSTAFPTNKFSPRPPLKHSCGRLCVKGDLLNVPAKTAPKIPIWWERKRN